MTEQDDAQPDYSDTVFLPKTSFQLRHDFTQLDADLVKRWDEEAVYEKLRVISKEEGRTPFVLHDGPPYANGHLHIGHALNKVLKDIIVRSQQMMGKDARYVPGWDCHGLPIEWKVEERYREANLDKNQVDVLEFRSECRKFAQKWVNVQRDEFKSLGVNGDWDDPYLTMNNEAEAVIAQEFMKFLMNESLYQGSKPVMWSPVEQTALAEAEVEYKEVSSHALWVSFDVASENELHGAKVVIWTTTPWTIPQNRAVAFGSGIAYGLYETTDGGRYLLADDRASDAFSAAKIDMNDVVRLRSVDEAELSGLTLKHPYNGIEEGHGEWDFDVPLILGEHVSGDAGTGFVHIAPSHGEDDYKLGQKACLPMTHNVQPDGTYRPDLPVFGGQSILDERGGEGPANVSNIRAIAKQGALFAKGKVRHSYPHSWRSKAPVIYRNTPQWFVGIDKPLSDGKGRMGDTIRERALNSIKTVKWLPESGENRIRSMVEGRPDWVLSRQRTWGVPLTCFVKKGVRSDSPDFVLKSDEVNKRVFEEFKKRGADAWYSKGFKERVLSGLFNPDEYEQVMDVLDVWFDSGSTHAFVVRDREDGSPDGVADLYLEGTDQHRGWFQSSLLQSCGTTGSAPYKQVLTHGFTMDEKGHKMSKSDGNTISPQEVMRDYGADVLRLWVTQSDHSSDLRIGKSVLKATSDSYRKMRNTLRFMLGALEGFDEAERVGYDEMPKLEKWVLHRLWELDETVKRGFSEYEFQKTFQELLDFANLDLSSFWFDVRKDSLYCDDEQDVKRRAFRTVMNEVFERLVLWNAPVLSFLAEEAWGLRYGQTRSVHLNDMKPADPSWRDDRLDAEMQGVRKARKAVTAALEVQRTQKVIRSSLEAAPVVSVSDEGLFDILNATDFAEVCITSGLTLIKGETGDAASVSVEFRPAEGAKCARCWKILPDVGSFAHACTCGRCSEVLSGREPEPLGGLMP